MNLQSTWELLDLLLTPLGLLNRVSLLCHSCNQCSLLSMPVWFNSFYTVLLLLPAVTVVLPHVLPKARPLLWRCLFSSRVMMITEAYPTTDLFSGQHWPGNCMTEWQGRNSWGNWISPVGTNVTSNPFHPQDQICQPSLSRCQVTKRPTSSSKAVTRSQTGLSRIFITLLLEVSLISSWHQRLSTDFLEEDRCLSFPNHNLRPFMRKQRRWGLVKTLLS